jgi:serine/threonine protein kinase
LDLLEGLLEFEPSRRLTAHEALRHPYFTTAAVNSGPAPSGSPAAVQQQHQAMLQQQALLRQQQDQVGTVSLLTFMRHVLIENEPFRPCVRLSKPRIINSSNKLLNVSYQSLGGIIRFLMQNLSIAQQQQQQQQQQRLLQQHQQQQMNELAAQQAAARQQQSYYGGQQPPSGY